jgi:hypothetical protein
LGAAPLRAFNAFFSSQRKCMVRSLCLVCVFLAVAAFGRDANQPVKKKSVELGMGYGYAYVPGMYDAKGNFSNWDEVFAKDTSLHPVLHSVPFRVKYGLGGGFDVKFDWDGVYSNAESGNLKGMGQPKLGVKYTGPNFGAFSNLTLPFATGTLNDKRLYTYLEVGGIARKKLAHARFTGIASYTEVFEKPDALRLSFKPEVLWNDRVSNYATLEYIKSTKKDVYLATLTPGLRADVNESFTIDAAAPFSIAGQNAPAGWSGRVILYWTLGY